MRLEHLIVGWAAVQGRIDAGWKAWYVTHPMGTDPETYEYTVLASNGIYMARCRTLGQTDAEAFAENYKDSKALEVMHVDEAVLHASPKINASFVQQVELVPRVGSPGSAQWTICSPNWARSTTWYQRYDQRTDKSTSANEAYTEYTTGLTNWINPDDFTLASQSYNKGGAAGFGFNNMWMPDGTRSDKALWRPVIKKNGVGQTSGYTFNYATGVVAFGSALTSNDVVTVTGRTVASSGGSAFSIRPTAGKKLVIPHVEINVSEDFVMTSPAVFEIWAGDPTYSFENGPVPPELAAYGLTARDIYCQYKMDYESMHQILGLSTGKVTKMEAVGGTGAVAPSAKNGWSTDQKRGFSCPHYEVIFDFGTPADFGQPIVLPSSVYAQMRVYLEGDIPFGGEYASVTFYAEEVSE